MKPLLTVALTVAIAIPCAVVQAAPLALETPVTYAQGASVVETVRRECGVEGLLERDVNKALAKANGTAEAPADAPRIRLQINDVFGVGGGAWSGPKSVSITASLVEGGKVTQTTQLRRTTTGGAFGGFKGTCAILERCTTALGTDVVRWAANPTAVDPKREPAEPPKAQ